jgi:hypothetical protein
MGMAQRVGLNQVRHVEVDVLWIQEQQARKLLPLKKIPGPRNPSDLCTKNVPANLLEQYMLQISVKVVEGRAAVAQQLHGLDARKLVNAPGEFGVLLAPVIGGQPVPAVTASGEVGVVLTPVLGGRPTGNRVRANRKRNAVDRYVDSWKIAGVKGKWVRSHRTPRGSLFTPHRVAGGPTAKENIGTTRVTKGTFIRSRRKFDIKDDYSVERDAHRMLEGAWTGTTEFHGISGDVDNNENQVDRGNEQHNMGEPRQYRGGGVEVGPDRLGRLRLRIRRRPRGPVEQHREARCFVWEPNASAQPAWHASGERGRPTRTGGRSARLPSVISVRRPSPLLRVLIPLFPPWSSISLSA